MTGNFHPIEAFANFALAVMLRYEASDLCVVKGVTKVNNGSFARSELAEGMTLCVALR